MRLSLAISPCPNDTFMFDALINRRIDSRGLEFDVTFADIEELNANVLGASGAPDISKISYAVLPAITDRYALLDSGSALGHGNGPLLVARPGVKKITKVAIPGIHTTANLLLKRLFPELTDRRPVFFSEIAPAVARGDFDAGVLIHEGRFTYRDYGLELVADLGAKWERVTSKRMTRPDPNYSPLDFVMGKLRRYVTVRVPGLPLPLGAIVASRSLPPKVVKTVKRLIRASIEYALANPEASKNFVKSHAREMDDAVIKRHIALFVNKNSLALDDSAHQAIHLMLGVETYLKLF